MSNRLASKFVADFNCDIDVATQNHMKKGVFMGAVIIINMCICCIFIILMCNLLGK